MKKSIKEKAISTAMNQAIKFISGNPKENLPKLLKWADEFDRSGTWESQRKIFHEVIENPDNNWNKYIMNLFEDVDNDILKTIFKNFIVNASMIGYPKQRELEKKHNCNIPWAILMDPTSACNLHCTGCWAAEYGNKLNMSYETLDNIINQANELAAYFFLYSGGEPLVRKKDIIKLCEAHSDCQFAAFTNGTLIDEEFADELLRVKNFVPVISVEGFEEATDFRRGNGVFAKVEKAMKILKEKKIPFGISCCYTSKNVDVIGSEEYFDQMINWGAKFCWFFTYMPVGKKAVPELMVTAQQRQFMYERVNKFRETKPLFTLDFWNDGAHSEGCVAGGRRYLHINANGDIEPCAFIHYSDSNIKDKTLLETLQSPLFQAYRKGQPFNHNHLRPCPLLDNPGALTQAVEQSGAHSTDLQNPEEVKDLSDKCKEAADKWAVVAEHIWEQSQCSKCKGCQYGENICNDNNCKESNCNEISNSDEPANQ
ncbi:radical SAM protein [Anaerocolumna aminovalerica]|uniref:Radical SAM superfamily enzyme, MoaA/NifB/PqqE/SkfB family n=1 Tax=Anaerocolumna aminovalerica TaxID=1527 RepID=A0A1I5FXM5_9FIRM|nr:radical SAM protein [Anaerocolumna aminovalerica]MDU6264635.1 radical SAM protein [Anaerocolumna aminovalerica]SFO28379.1 Radical SAM superfamily enzyme, MoaA/NifB/PqqE/SkfB family [Anaerocolumna aminovalerica]